MAHSFKLYANTRLRMAVREQMDRDPQGEIFNELLYEKYVKKHEEAFYRQVSLGKATTLADAALIFLLYGKNITIPGTNLGIQDIPAAIYVFLGIAALGFLALSLAFLNGLLYLAIIDQFNLRKSEKLRIDPDYLTFSDIYSEIYVKVFRETMDFHYGDKIKPSKRYIRYHSFAMSMIMLSYISMLITHFSIIGRAIYAIWEVSFSSIAFCASIFLMTIVSLMANFMISFEFAEFQQSRHE